MTFKQKFSNWYFEDTVVVPRNDIEDDQYALYGTLIQMLGQNAAQIWGDLAVEALLQPALTNKINDREMFMKGIDYSYYYEEDSIEVSEVEKL